MLFYSYSSFLNASRHLFQSHLSFELCCVTGSQHSATRVAVVCSSSGTSGHLETEFDFQVLPRPCTESSSHEILLSDQISCVNQSRFSLVHKKGSQIAEAADIDLARVTEV
ncbi:hypothetical protein Nmel_010907 [Mimus melanotis]